MLALTTLLLPFAAAKYAPLSTSSMMVTADLVVMGEIVSVSDETFTLRVDRAGAGPEVGGEIEVLRFQDWTCASRWAPYAEGQQVFLMLVETDAGLRIQSAGGEGEAPVIDGEIWLRDWSLADHRGPAPGVGVYGTPATPDAVFAASEALRSCYAPGAAWHEPLVGRCGPERLAALAGEGASGSAGFALTATLLEQAGR